VGETTATTDGLLTAAEVAEMLGVSTATVLDRWQAGELPGYRLWGKKGGPVRFRRSEIVALLESWRGQRGEAVGAGGLTVPPATPAPGHRVGEADNPTVSRL
jgi:excisionase family DNA binding protein